MVTVHLTLTPLSESEAAVSHTHFITHTIGNCVEFCLLIDIIIIVISAPAAQQSRRTKCFDARKVINPHTYSLITAYDCVIVF